MTTRPYEDVIAAAGRDGRILHRDDIYGSGPPVDAVSEEIYAFVRKHVGATVLDIGCGIGPYVARLSADGVSATGIELNEIAVDAARALGRDVRLGSAYELPFEDGSFETVILIESLEHFDDPDAALREARRVCRRNAVVTVPDVSAIPVLSALQVVPWHLLEASHVNFFSPASLRTALLGYFDSCESTQLGRFLDVGEEGVFMHAAAVAELSAP